MFARIITRSLSRIPTKSGLFVRCLTPMQIAPSAPTQFIQKMNMSSAKTLTQDGPIGQIDEMISSIYDHIKNSSPENYTEEEKNNKVLKPRTLSESYRKFLIPLSTDNEKREKYLSASRNVRMGKILEDIDHMAVHIGYVHNSEDGTIESRMSLPRNIVTASVHRIDFHKEDLNPNRDLIIDGQVTYAGTSSMQISIRLFQNDDNQNLQLLLKANFIMVARDPLDATKKIRIHGLVAKTPDEAETVNLTKEHLIRMGNKDEKKATNDELRLIDNLHRTLLGRNMSNEFPILKDEEIWMHKTHLSLTEICFPEFQNMYGKIFGGFLMRKALELAYVNAKLFCKGKVSIRSMDQIQFAKPVEIGNILHFDSYVTYNQGDLLQLKVVASISDEAKFKEIAKTKVPSMGQEARLITNVFHFTMQSVENKEIMKVLPKHYNHTGMYIAGRRHLLNTLKRTVSLTPRHSSRHISPTEKVAHQ
ncbi:unnamed protein product [Caenorhabditis angaria]|uniref:HotDog ACOT-type domain-containing protein n=1 Tax=Caenorhabditis angaria TaxID=860376 RepID=A0A9P1N847_9PELO|nr:unnamed protein product [Caenorhabditis angaria]